MDIGEIVMDSLKYPISDYTKILLLGVIFVLSSISSFALLFTYDGTVLTVLGLVGMLIGLLGSGYLFRILKASVAGIAELPDFDDLVGMFIDGIKVAIVGIVYAIPAIILIAIFAFSMIMSLLSAFSSDPSSAAAGMFLGAGLGILLAMLYMLIIAPIIALALAHMASTGELGAAFRFSELVDRISQIGWGDLIIWYIVTGVVYLVLSFVGALIARIFGSIYFILGVIVMGLIIYPYIRMYLFRSIALLYTSK